MRNIGDLKKHFGQLVNKAKSLIPHRGQQPQIQQDEVAKVPEREIEIQETEIKAPPPPQQSGRTQINKNHDLLSEVANRNPAGIRWNIEDGANIHFLDDVALRSAVSLGYRDVVEILLQLGADVHAKDEASLYTAIYLRDFDLANRLMLEDADVDKMLDANQDLIDGDFMKSLDDLHDYNGKAAFEKSYAATRKKHKTPSFKTQRQ